MEAIKFEPPFPIVRLAENAAKYHGVEEAYVIWEMDRNMRIINGIGEPVNIAKKFVTHFIDAETGEETPTNWGD